MAKIEIDGIGTIELDDAFKDLAPEEQQKVIEGIVAQSGGAARAPEKERLRAMAQGLSFGLSDEATAALTNPLSAARAAFGDETGGAEYYKRLESEREKLEGYRQAYPLSSAGYELLGGAIPAVAATALTRRPEAGQAAIGPAINRMIAAAPKAAALGFGAGGLYGFGVGEGGPVERLKSAAPSAVGGGIAGPVAQAATYPLSIGAKSLIDAGRRLAGGRGGKAVEAELQRLAEGTGMTVDDIAQRVANGEIMAENETLRMATRYLMSRGGRGEALTREVLAERAPRKRAEAMADIQKYLADGEAGNVLAATRASEEAAARAEKAVYGSLFDVPTPAPGARPALEDAFSRFPALGSEAAAYVRGATKTTPFFKVAEDGAVTLTREPTLQEAEVFRRYLQKKTNEAFTSSSPFGPLYKEAELELRQALDELSPKLRVVRAQAAAIRNDRDAFKAGQEVFGKSADQIEIDFGNMAPELLAPYRAGFADALRRKVQAAGGTSLMSALANPDRKEGMIFRTLFPGETFEDVMGKIGVAAQAQEARGDIIKGPSTALTQAAGKESGAAVNLGDLAGAASLNPVAVAQTGFKLLNQLTPELTAQQRFQVLRVLLSEDPDVVRRALQDRSGLAAFTQRVKQAVDLVESGTTGATRTGGAMYGQEFKPQ